jgi:hypothetical protein
MRLFHGLSRTDYQDLLRAIGWFIDERGYTSVRIIEVDDGIVLQGHVSDRAEPAATFETYLITDDELKTMIREAARRRGQAPPAYTD